MELSARNQIRGRVTSVTLGTVMAEIAIEIGAGQTIVSTISLASVERLKVRVGDAVTAIIEATEVLVGKWSGRVGLGGGRSEG